ncbi:thiolase family protein [Rhodococcus sp. NPDC058514]|uniref:thiolase C-terminal domain-containing protein n=1 Tax=unclassified Rhodococcus (in: high G+C Gram-positive bacteria) TaxID=192944 RepID=UPI0036623C20
MIARGAVVSGIGRVPRGPAPCGVGIAAQAARGALADAGLTGGAVDGLVTCGLPDTVEVGDALGLELSWRTVESDRLGVLAAVSAAVAAVASGLATHVLCVEASDPPRPVPPEAGRFSGRPSVSGWAQWHAPYGAGTELVTTALAARSYVEAFGLTRVELAQIALTACRNGGRGIGLREYLDAPMLADPLCVHDRAAPAGGATAVVISRGDIEGDLPAPAVTLEAVAAARSASRLWEQRSELTTMAIHSAGQRLWAGTELGPDDVDVALVEDEFSFLALIWLEALGFCAQGMAGAFVAGGQRISRTGALPLNPHGGQLGLGRSAALELVAEAVAQLRGESSAQLEVPPEVAVVGVGGATVAGCLLLVR